MQFPFDCHLVFLVIAAIGLVSSQLPLKTYADADVDKSVKKNSSSIELISKGKSNYIPVGMLDVSRGRDDISNSFVLEEVRVESGGNEELQEDSIGDEETKDCISEMSYADDDDDNVVVVCA